MNIVDVTLIAIAVIATVATVYVVRNGKGRAVCK